MIDDGFIFLTAIVVLCASLLAMERTSTVRLFTWLPPIVLIMFGAMLGYTLGIWEFTESVRATRESTRDLLIPMMLCGTLPLWCRRPPTARGCWEIIKVL